MVHKPKSTQASIVRSLCPQPLLLLPRSHLNPTSMSTVLFLLYPDKFPYTYISKSKYKFSSCYLYPNRSYIIIYTTVFLAFFTSQYSLGIFPMSDHKEFSYSLAQCHATPLYHQVFNQSFIEGPLDSLPFFVYYQQGYNG